MLNIEGLDKKPLPWYNNHGKARKEGLEEYYEYLRDRVNTYPAICINETQ